MQSDSRRLLIAFQEDDEMYVPMLCGFQDRASAEDKLHKLRLNVESLVLLEWDAALKGYQMIPVPHE